MRYGTASFMFVLLPFLCAAAEEGEKPRDEEGQVIVVSATRTETPLWETGSSIDVISRESIRREAAEPVFEVMDEIPGLTFADLGTPGQQTALFTRGSNSDHTLVLIDGVRINDENSVIDFAPFLNLGLQSVEVFRGTGSSMYGTDAMGGVISMETLKGQGPPELRLTAAGTSEDGFLFDLSFSGSEDSSCYAFGGGMYRYGGPDYPNSDAHSGGGFLRMDQGLLDGSSLKFVVRVTDSEAGWYTNNATGFGPGVAGVYLDPNDRIYRDSILSSMVWSKNINPDAEISVRGGVFNYQAFFESIAPNDPAMFGPSPGTQSYDLKRYSTGIKCVNAFGISDKVVWGLDYERMQFDKVDTMYFDTRFDARDDTGLYAQYHKVLRDSLALTVSGRYEYDTEFGSFVTWRGAAAYRTGLDENLLFRASAGQAFRAPNFLELYGAFGPNPDLEPERNIGIDAGLEYTVLDDNLKFTATYFRNSFSDLIEYDFIAGFQNVAEAMSQGVEVSIGQQESQSLPFFWRLAGTYTHTEDEAGEALLRRPWFIMDTTAGVCLQENLHLGLDARYVSSWHDIDETYSTVTVPGYAVLNVTLSWEPVEGTEIFFKALNVMDRYYAPVYSFPAPGFNWMFGIRTGREF